MVANKTWFDVNGDATYAINWPLDRYSTVFEVGAYEGRWAKQIMDKYGCTVHAFEPQYWAVAKLLYLQQQGFNKLQVHPYALGTKAGVLPMGEYETDACSFLHVGQRRQGEGEMRDACKVIDELCLVGSRDINLMMINIEGYEYELLNYLIHCGATDHIERLCVQWHQFADPSGGMYKSLKEKLYIEGFNSAWSFYPTLEAFTRSAVEL